MELRSIWNIRSISSEPMAIRNRIMSIINDGVDGYFYGESKHNVHNEQIRVKVINKIKEATSSRLRNRKDIMLLRSLSRKLIKRTIKTRHNDNPTLQQAKARADWSMFEEAIRIEMKQMIDDDVYIPWSRDKLPEGANLLGTMLVLTIKRNAVTGVIDKYKARLVALGNQQDPTSYEDIKSGTARSASVKLLISIQAKTSATSMVLDVKGAYLKSSLRTDFDEKLFLKLPNGQLVKLRKYLYGLKQAGYEWEQNVTECLLENGYSRSKTDPLLFSHWTKDNNFIIMCIHVDDFYVVSSTDQLLKNI